MPSAQPGAPAPDEQIAVNEERPVANTQQGTPGSRDSSSDTGDSGIDPVLSSLFLSAAGIILAFLDPINIGFEGHLAETLILVLAGVALLAWGTVRHQLAFLLAGATLVLATIAMAVFSQPTQLNVSLMAYWPLRAALFLLVAFTWMFLLRPPGWMTGALIAAAIPTALVLLLMGWPAAAVQLFRSTVGLPTNSNFSPYWMSFDSHGNLYASDLDGAKLWLFDSAGSPQGIIYPATSPAVGTPGPGILPNGYESEAALIAPPTPTPAPNQRPPGISFDFCGLAIDPQDNTYLLDLGDPNGFTILRYDTLGDITARWPVPSSYGPTSDCLAADANYIYLSGVGNKIYVLDHQGKEVKELTLPVQQFAISSTTLKGPEGGNLLVASAPEKLMRIDVSSGKAVTATFPTQDGFLQAPMLVTQKGELLMSDHQQIKIVRLDLNTLQVLGTIGVSGVWPGQFGDVGGLAEDRAGNIYVSDYVHRVIQRFSPDGKVAGVLWAADPTRQNGEQENQ